VPDNPVVWIIAIVAVFVVVLVALWKGQMVEVELKPLRLRFKRAGGAGEAGGGISVGEGMVIKDSKTGDIAGVKAAGATSPGGTVSVGKGAQITDSTTGDIVGVKQAGSGEPKP
jgi:hypothetical protein